MPVAGAPHSGGKDQLASPLALRAVAFARGAIGTPYVWGGESSNGYDCSGLVQAAYSHAGKSIPRTSEEQWNAGYPDVPWGRWAPGDLIFSQWPGDGTSPGHVVIYEGAGWTIAAPHTGTTVEREPVDTFKGSPYVGSKRPAPLSGQGNNTQSSNVQSSSSSGLGILAISPLFIVVGLAIVGIGAVLLFKSRPQVSGTEGSV